jgi:hypothetical protein
MFTITIEGRLAEDPTEQADSTVRNRRLTPTANYPAPTPHGRVAAKEK